LLAGGREPARGTETGPDCRVPPDLIAADRRLPALAQRLHDKRPVTIVALGGASTAGTAAGGNGQNAYPHDLEVALRQRHKDVPITVLNRGVARQTASEMIDRFPKDVYANEPALVLWEAGTVDAVRGTDPDEFTTTLVEGVEALKQHGYEVILIDMQYNPSTVSVINFEPYLDALHRTADLEDIYLFKRFDIMRYWSEAGVFDFVNVAKENRTMLAEQVYQCLGEGLADAIDAATQ
jgi:lysophospholipase L1-like esterase